MCVLFSSFLIGCFFSTVVSRQADIDINRVKLISNEAYPDYPSHPRRFPEKYYQFKRSHDHDDSSSWFLQPSAPLRPLHDATSMPSPEALQVHQPREDPKLFYQSDSYLQENHRKNIEREVSSIFPGREVIRASEKLSRPRFLSLRLDRSANRIFSGNNLCVKCPHDRTLVARPGSDRVMLQYPRMTTCAGHKAPRDARFLSLYGPKFGSLITQGSHVIIGRISYRGKDIQMCKMQVHVIVQTCQVPSYLVSKCDDRSGVCDFSCSDPTLELHGSSSLSCGDNMGWKGWTGSLPVCRARTWCKRPEPPAYGRLSCKGSTDAGFAEGSVCRVKCSRGKHWSPRSATVCRRGAWTVDITCEPRRTYASKSPNDT